jgi:Peptidase family M49
MSIGKSIVSVMAVLALMHLSACSRAPNAAAPANVSAAAAFDYGPQLAKFREVKMPYDASALTSKQQQMVSKLLQATRLLDELFWEQSDPEGLKLYHSLAGSARPQDLQLRRMLVINGGRYDLISENAPFAGAPPKPAGANLYPADLTQTELNAYVTKHPEQRAALHDSFTVVRRKGEVLEAIPYHVAYAAQLAPITQALRDAADLSDDAAFANFLRMRAAALLTDDYFKSDLAWLDLKNPQFDVIFAPYETYLDNFLGVKTSYGAAVLIRNDAESRKLEVFQKYVPDIQDALPLPAVDRPSKKGHSTPMEVMETPLRGGDLRHGYQAVADNLPNDARVHEQKGSKKIFFKNFMDARTNNVILPIAKKLISESQSALATADGYLTFVLMHEVSHGIGPAFARTKAGKRDIREAIGSRFSALEEAKADIVSLYGVRWLADHGHFDHSKLNGTYVSRLADIFRTVRFGIAEAHGLADIMQFNYLVEQGAISLDASSGRFALDLERVRVAVATLSKELLEQEATGDRDRTEAWFAKYGSMPPQLAKALASASDVPVDIDPVSQAEGL